MPPLNAHYLLHATLAGKYRMDSLIGEGSVSVVYRATDVSHQNRLVAIKVLKNEKVSNRVEDLIRFRNEANVAASLHHPQIIQIYEIGEQQQLQFLVMELVDGVSLQQVLQSGRLTLSEADAVNVLVRVCHGLQLVHDANLVHKDLKPANILVGYGQDRTPDFQQIKLIDFGLAQVQDFGEGKGTSTVSGTFAYISPEQSGFLKRPVDGRSDLYSLGVIFYQLVTGRLPFEAQEVAAILHQHVAKTPEPPSYSNPLLPRILEKMILKLLEKEPENRYQSAQGLLQDLLKFQAGQREFSLGTEDKLFKLNFRTQLVGRELELIKLKKLFEQVRGGRGGLCLISGDPGKGKTRLVEEFQAFVYDEGGLFLGSKCFSGENKIPYGPFQDALNEYLRRFEKYPAGKREELQVQVRQDLGKLGEVVLRLNPILKVLTGECPPLVELEPDRENQRFLLVNSQFLLHLSRHEGGIVIFMDDLQWADEGSLSLLEEVLEGIQGYPLLILGTYRDNEIPPGHRLHRLLDPGKPVTELRLANFDSHSMNQFVARLLFDHEENSRELSEFVLAKSKGNPFFAIQIMKQLVDERAVQHGDQHWFLDRERLSLSEIPGSIVDILLRRILLLNEQEAGILSYAAVIGRQFDIQMLFDLSGLPHKTVVDIVDKAIGLQLMETSTREKGKILFAHDRIKEAFYLKLGEQKRRTLHLRIGQEIEARVGTAFETVIFDLAYHFVEAHDPGRILKYCLPAAEKAKAGYANEEAIKYYRTCIAQLESQDLKGNEDWLHCQENIGEIYLRIGKNDESIELYRRILPHMHGAFEKAGIYKQICQAYFKKGNAGQCEEYGRRGLRLLGEHLPITPLQVFLSLIAELSRHILHLLFPFLFVRRRENTGDQRHRLMAWYYYPLASAYAISDVMKAVRGVLRMLNIAETHLGPSKELAVGIGGYAAICSAVGWFSRAIRYHHLALRMEQTGQDDWAVAMTLQFLGYCYEFLGDYQKSNEYFALCTEQFRKIGDIRELGLCINGTLLNDYYVGNYPAFKHNVDRYFEIVNKVKDDYGISDCWHYYAQYYSETGNYPEALDAALMSYRLAREKSVWLECCVAAIDAGSIYYEIGDLEHSREYLEEARTLYHQHHFLSQYSAYLFAHLADTYHALWASAPRASREAGAWRRKTRHACRAAGRETRHWPTHRPAALRAAANYLASCGRLRRARQLYESALQGAAGIQRRYELGRALFDYGRFLRKTDDPGSDHQLEAALRLFKEIGAEGYRARVASLLGFKEEEDKTSLQRLVEKQRMYSIIKVSQDISSILELDKLLGKVLSVALEVTGAQRGFLFIRDAATGKLERLAGKSVNENLAEGAGFSQHILQEVLEKGEAVLVGNASGEGRYQAFDSIVGSDLKSVLCLPIKFKQEIQGVCYLDNPLSSSIFKPEDVEILNALMTQAAISIENARLYELAVTDGLTKTFTHRHFQYLLAKEVERATRYHHPLSLLMLDIDQFKRCNDTYGHPFGDKVLAGVAALLKGNCRGIDMIARYGGEEFTAILPETSSEEAMVVAERLRQHVEEFRLPWEDTSVSVTISIGVASFPLHAGNKEGLIQAADRAMYAAKARGRNCIQAAEMRQVDGDRVPKKE